MDGERPGELVRLKRRRGDGDLSLAVVEREQRLPLFLVPREDERNLAVHHLALGCVVVAGLDDARTDAEFANDGRSVWVEALLELGVQGGQSHDSAPHRDERHHLGARVEAAPRQRLADEFEHRLPQGFGAAARDPDEVLVELLPSEVGVRFVEREEGRLAVVDAAGAADDEGACSLAVDRGQVDARRHVAFDEVGEHAARADWWQLVGVADEQYVAVAGGAEQRVGELERQHRRLVDDHELDVVGERIVLVA